ncbi:hypothetical protein L2E82_14351 [Cichorium intybus]|uniref:Uncharacterized protein n=1 Tax=Cichorium intybus TaxID=13427 RepID=A0ACB9EZQ1_CICIN|nr:hypothetical protein L2E82_14351 [Cichorium intybus]
MKRIEDKAFSKRKVELNKNARRLSDLHDADVAVVVVSSGGELYEYCSGGTDREAQNSEHAKSFYSL